MMDNDVLLDKIFAEIENARENSDLDSVLRISGEAAARINEQLRSAPVDSEDAVLAAKRSLVITDMHCMALIEAGEINEAAATYVGIILYILTCKVNPEKIPQLYEGTLITLVEVLSMIMSDIWGNPEAMDHVTSCFAETGTLAIETYDHFSKFASMGMFSPKIESLRPILQTIAPKGYQFNGRKITSIMAMDILYDVLARMKSCGLINIDEY